EQYDAGVRVTDSEQISADYAAPRRVSYQLYYKDVQRPLAPQVGLQQVEVGAFEAYAVGGAVAQSPLSYARRGQPAGIPGAVARRQERYAVVGSQDLTAVTAGQDFASEAEALGQLRQLLQQQPGLAGKIQVLPAYQMNTVG